MYEIFSNRSHHKVFFFFFTVTKCNGNALYYVWVYGPSLSSSSNRVSLFTTLNFLFVRSCCPAGVCGLLYCNSVCSFYICIYLCLETWTLVVFIWIFRSHLMLVIPSYFPPWPCPLIFYPCNLPHPIIPLSPFISLVSTFLPLIIPHLPWLLTNFQISVGFPNKTFISKD